MSASTPSTLPCSRLSATATRTSPTSPRVLPRTSATSRSCLRGYTSGITATGPSLIGAAVTGNRALAAGVVRVTAEAAATDRAAGTLATRTPPQPLSAPTVATRATAPAVVPVTEDTTTAITVISAMHIDTQGFTLTAIVTEAAITTLGTTTTAIVSNTTTSGLTTPAILTEAGTLPTVTRSQRRRPATIEGGIGRAAACSCMTTHQSPATLLASSRPLSFRT